MILLQQYKEGEIVINKVGGGGGNTEYALSSWSSTWMCISEDKPPSENRVHLSSQVNMWSETLEATQFKVHQVRQHLAEVIPHILCYATTLEKH